jgi:hypothetical protein
VLALVASALTLAVVPLNRQVRRLSPGRLAEIDAKMGRAGFKPALQSEGNASPEQFDPREQAASDLAQLKPEGSVSPERVAEIRAKFERAGYKTIQRRPGEVAVPGPPEEVSVPNWPARLTLAGSELLVGLAIVVVLSLFRRRPHGGSE